MRSEELMLEPFAPETLAAIRAAFRAVWPDLTAGACGDPVLRNKAVGTIANLARTGILDADELTRKAQARLRARRPRAVPHPPAFAAGALAAAARAGAAYSGSVAP